MGPIIGATVKVKGTNNAAVTDMDTYAAASGDDVLSNPIDSKRGCVTTG